MNPPSRLRCEYLENPLVLEYPDGRSETICTDTAWRAATGPILGSDLYNGETYDARLEVGAVAEHFAPFDAGGQVNGQSECAVGRVS